MIASAKPEKITFRIKRQDNKNSQPYWEVFELDYRPNMNVISALQRIAENPVTKEGKQTTPVVWDCNCLEEVCGACSMLINGTVRQSCSALVDELLDDTDNGPIILEPMTKFPVVRDLWVDRARMFEGLKNFKGWVPIDGTHDLGEGPKETPEEQEFRYALSRCMTCGCCLEACPQFLKDNDFMGASVIGQVVYFNEHQTGAILKDDRLDLAMGPNGLSECGNAQNCVKVCPKEVPLTEAIAKLGRQTTVHAIKRFFVKKK